MTATISTDVLSAIEPALVGGLPEDTIFVPTSGRLSTSIRNSLLSERRLDRRDWNDHIRGSHRNDDRFLRWPQILPFTGTEPEVGSFGTLETGADDISAEAVRLVTLFDGQLGRAEVEELMELLFSPSDDHGTDDDMWRELRDPHELEFDEIAALMSEAPGVPEGRIWIERFDHRDPDPDMLTVGTIAPCRAYLPEQVLA